MDPTVMIIWIIVFFLIGLLGWGVWGSKVRTNLLCNDHSETSRTRGGRVRRILIVGGGYAGFYTAWGLEKRLRPGEAEVTVVDPRPYMTYQPFLPEVAAGSIEARHAAVSLRRHLRRTKIIAGR